MIRGRGGRKRNMISITRIKKDLKEQLAAQKKTGKFYEDLVDDYIFLKELKDKMKKDIEVNGIRLKVTNGNGFQTEKPNESCTNIIKVNAQMLKILSELNIQDNSLNNSNKDNKDYELC